MLKLEKMGICGFKSFSDRTEVHFQDGITAVVGPNGCGKSNIGDAINWVLGEQSPRMLRGQQMADVIFNGSEARKPLGMAEVSMLFAGTEGLEHNDQGRISLTRRLFRSGESEYLINGSRARLKDIQDFLRQAHVGARTYATIEQGKIDQVLNAKPKERRALIEDAAGVSGYKHKRRLAELKLEATQANLLRVHDIITEVRRQINALKRQAAKARRYRRLREALRGKELLRFASRARDLDAELRRLREAEGLSREAEAAATAGLAGKEVELLERREALERTERALRESAASLHRLEIQIDREEAEIRACRERIEESGEAGARCASESERIVARRAECEERRRRQEESLEQGRSELERLSGALAVEQAALTEADAARRELRERIESLRRQQFESMSRGAELRNRLRGAQEGLAQNEMRRARLEAERIDAREDWRRLASEAGSLAERSGDLRRSVEELREQQAQSEIALREARDVHAALVSELAEAREQEQSALARLATLEDLETRFAGVSDGVKNLLGGGQAAGIRVHGVVADYLEASREIEGVAESYLASLLPTVIVEDDIDACRAADLLRSRGAGRTSMICRTQPVGAPAVGPPMNGNGETPREVLEDARVLGRLRERLMLKTSANGALADRIGDAFLVDSLDAALELHRRHPKADYLTRDGEVVYASGVVSAGGRRGGDQGLLVHKRRTEESRSAAAEAAIRGAGLEERVAAANGEVERLDAERRERGAALEAADRRAVELELEARHSAGETVRSGRRSEILADELAGLEAEASSLGTTIEQLVAEQQEVEGLHGVLERDLLEHTERMESEESLGRQRVERVTELRAAAAAGGQRQQALVDEARRLGDEIGEIRSRLEELERQAAAASERARAGAELLERTERDLLVHLTERAVLSGAVETSEREIAERREGLAALEQDLRSSRTGLESLREATRVAELERARAESAREHLDELCRQELGVAAAEGAATIDESAPIDLEALEREVVEIRERIERLGPVNMTAIEEFSELEQRHGFLATQKADLEQSMESLRETIRRINRESRQRFSEVFEAVRKSYQEVFALLFNGGRADLRLEEGEDVLECGIEILAQPPGKRLAGVQLLSGGEKALSAIALLFAIFRCQPSPFCVLDEVDAALDDANVSRFARMVREYARHTQFIIVTHNKLSMDAADLLYGVTMEEPGVSRVVSLQLR